MGAWGTSPFSSDDFGDAFDGIRMSLNAAVAKALAHELKRTKELGVHYESGEWAWVGLVIWAYHAGFDVDDFVGKAIDICDRLSHGEWIDSWRDKSAMRRTITKVTKQLADIKGHHEERGLIPALQDELSAKRGR